MFGSSAWLSPAPVAVSIGISSASRLYHGGLVLLSHTSQHRIDHVYECVLVGDMPRAGAASGVNPRDYPPTVLKQAPSDGQEPPPILLHTDETPAIVISKRGLETMRIEDRGG